VGKLGDTFRERRIALGVTLEQAQEATRIRAKLIEALEEGDYVKLPNPGYVRGYISSYARFLELDPVPLLALYKAETGVGRYHELNLPQAEEAVAPTGQQHAVPLRSAVVVVLVIALLSLSVWAVTRIWRGPEPTPPAPASLGVPTETVTPSTGGEEVAKPADKAASTLEPFTVSVIVAKNAASWIEVTVDGKQAYAGTLTGGQGKRFEAAESASRAVVSVLPERSRALESLALEFGVPCSRMGETGGPRMVFDTLFEIEVDQAVATYEDAIPGLLAG